MKEFTCLRCGHKWTSRVESPQACPKCKSYQWNKEKIIVEEKKDK